MNRREFLQGAGAVALAAAAGPMLSLGAAEKPVVTARHLPRWRGFNLLEKFVKQEGGNPPFPEADFALMAEWGFDFVRLPLSYLCWTEPGDWLKLREAELKHIDEAVAFGGKHGVHVNLNLHRAPGYCVNPPKEPLDLWKDEQALAACAFHWAQFAKRYQGIPNDRLSFDLINEPGAIPEEAYVRVV
ncbi:MAG: cellulase family glycosylhydrolase, partial [Verrucomicrobia bacterium]|nr:cellulase family glycosylhydrolase [Verrucomicrobiota bacterium]